VKLPELSAILSVLGKPLNDRGFRGLFAPLGFDQRREDLVGGQHAQFRDAYGFDLGFRRSSSVERWTEAGVRGLAFAEITFFRERMLDARGWAGELPLGVRFDDSPDMLLAKVPAPPDDRFDAEFTGWMLWHLPQYSLQIHYSSMENFVLRVRIMAPGVWASYAAA
jgi:hypothetical protein